LRVLIVAEAPGPVRRLSRFLRSRGHDAVLIQGVYDLVRQLSEAEVVIVDALDPRAGSEVATLVRRSSDARVILYGDAQGEGEAIARGRLEDVARLLEPDGPESHAFRGTLGAFSVLDLVQFLLLSGASGCLSIDSAERGKRLYFEGGSIVSAHGSGASGEESFLDAARSAEGEFRFEPGVVPLERNLTRSTNALLLDAARSLDERCVHAA
jgi:hypothetical protein